MVGLFTSPSKDAGVSDLSDSDLDPLDFLLGIGFDGEADMEFLLQLLLILPLPGDLEDVLNLGFLLQKFPDPDMICKQRMKNVATKC
jgi:hypothetical protein